MAKVECVKVGSIRPKGYQNLREWMADPNNVYIGRRGVVFIDKVRYPPSDSLFANPFKINAGASREQVIEQYEAYIREKLNDPEYLRAFKALKGKTLGCWCKPEACHGDVLVKLIEEFS